LKTCGKLFFQLVEERPALGLHGLGRPGSALYDRQAAGPDLLDGGLDAGEPKRVSSNWKTEKIVVEKIAGPAAVVRLGRSPRGIQGSSEHDDPTSGPAVGSPPCRLLGAREEELTPEIVSEALQLAGDLIAEKG